MTNSVRIWSWTPQPSAFFECSSLNAHRYIWDDPLASMYRNSGFQGEITSHCLCLYHRFTLSFREIELLMLTREIEVTHETILVHEVQAQYARTLRRRQPPAGDKWHLDEVFIKIGGFRKYLWRAVGQRGNVLDTLIQSKRNGRAATSSFGRS
ncbi:DDE-type integrase/transposase/recombinase [Rhodococcus jostii]|uniref:DDE-type integrase/transposase/recombinase n=1 Tax=Rhodococcus jostii TaxID=132919 RepID=UPI003631EE21